MPRTITWAFTTATYEQHELDLIVSIIDKGLAATRAGDWKAARAFREEAGWLHQLKSQFPGGRIDPEPEPEHEQTALNSADVSWTAVTPRFDHETGVVVAYAPNPEPGPHPEGSEDVPVAVVRDGYAACAPGCRADFGAGLHKPECIVPPF